MIKLKKIEPKYKNKFVVEISVDHGDSDKNELIPVDFDTEEELINNLLHYWNTKNIVEMQIKCKEIYDKYFLNSIFFDKILS